jgi:hypothetical protein
MEREDQAAWDAGNGKGGMPGGGGTGQAVAGFPRQLRKMDFLNIPA